MGMITGTVTGFDEKTSKKGNIYHRIQIRGENGYQSWYTSFAGKPVQNGQRIRANLEQNKNGDGEFIDNLEVIDSAPTQEPPRSAQNGPSQGASPDADTWRKKDLNIATQAIFKTIYENNGDDSVHEQIKIAFKAACVLEKQINAYVAGADISGMKESLQDQVAAQANEDLSNQANTDTGNPGEPEHPAFDDDIPF